jgi:hypothetical protein
MKTWVQVACAAAVSMACALYVGCGSSSREAFSDDAADGGLDAHNSLATSDASVAPDCSPTSTNLAGCACTQIGATQACYSGDPATRRVGTCHDGTQTCSGDGEFLTWGPCNGDVVPVSESCTGTVDQNCNGKVGCADPTCATDPACNTGCTDGQTRLCYDGPAGTENRGTCKDGMQTCTGGKWPSTCPGEVLPAAENCCDALDHNCNGAAGCFDLFFCITASCCQNACTSANVDPGCVCPTGSGDTATCPSGDHGVDKGGFPPFVECCPCTASTCNDPGCCGESVCSGNPSCAGLNCKPLPASCNGMVNADCDDFPEDCDEPCCKCTNCP